MEYPNLFPGVDVTRLEDGDDSMAYGKRCDNLDMKHESVEFANNITRFRIRVAGSHAVLPQAHKTTDLGQRK